MQLKNPDTYHEQVLLLVGLETSVAEVTRSINKLQFNLLQCSTTRLGQQ